MKNQQVSKIKTVTLQGFEIDKEDKTMEIEPSTNFLPSIQGTIDTKNQIIIL